MPGYLTRQLTLRSGAAAKPVAALRRARHECEATIANVGCDNGDAFPPTLSLQGCGISALRRRFVGSDRASFSERLSSHPR